MGEVICNIGSRDVLLSTTLHVWSKIYRDNDDPSGILNTGKTRKTFIQGFSSLIIFLKAGDKLPTIILNTYTVILHLVTILKPSMVGGTSL